MERRAQLSSFDLKALVKEFQELVSGYIDKIWQPSNQELLIRIRTKAGKKNLLINLKGWIFIVSREEKIEVSRKQTDFATALRKRLTNGKLSQIKQHDFDRIIELEVQKARKYTLVIELFSKGNIVLLSDHKIISCSSKQVWRHRVVKPGLEYKYPPSKPDPFKISAADFKAELRKTKRDVVRALVSELKLPPIYAEEICATSTIDKALLASLLTDKELEKLYAQMINLGTKELTPRIVLSEGRAVDVTPVALNRYKGYKFKKFTKFNQAVEEFFWLVKEEEERKLREAPILKECEKLKQRLELQESAVKEWLSKSLESRALGDLIARNHLRIAQILAKIAQAEDLSKVEEISNLNRVEGWVEIFIDNKLVRLDLRKSAFENASYYYELSKRSKRKLEGVRKALAESKKKLELMKKKKIIVKEAKKPEEPKFWFEKYRWFFSSDNALVLAGRDAKSNDKLVKKHLKAQDRYAHADLHGAPSVVVKSQSELSLKEACEFALIHSKAWSAKHSSGSAYWVLPEQVSKRAPPGEFVPKGAFIIRGRKNYFRNLSLQAGIGLVKLDHVAKIMCAPAATIKSKSNKWIIFAPGALEKAKFAKQLAKGFDINIDKIMRVLPPGGVKIIEKRNISI